MPSTYTSNNKIQKIATGEQSGTWGNTTNTNFDLFDTAIDGFVSVTLSGTTHTLNIPDGSAGDGRNKVLVFTGTLAATNTVSVTPNTVKKHYYVQNNTTGGQSIIISQGSGSTVTVKNGYSSIVYLDGAGSSAAVKEVLTSLKLTALLEATGAVLNGSSSGSTTLQASAAASGTLTLPAATDTLVGKATTDTFTNKTFDTAGTGNVLRINGTQVSAVTGTGSVVLATSPTLVTPLLGTPTSGTLTNCTGLPVSTGISGLGANVATFLATPSSANLAGAVTDETGSGALVFANTPTLVTPLLGTPTSGTLTNCTGLPISTGVSGLGSGVATFLATPSSANLASAVADETGTGALVFANTPTLVTPVLGTPTSGTLTNCTGLPISSGVSGLGSNVATFLATPSSANLAAAVTDETGTGALVFGTSPTIATPTITTRAIVPVIVGGTGTTSTLTLYPTTGVGTTGADIIFQNGNNGGTEVMRILHGGNVGIGVSTANTRLHVDSDASNTDGTGYDQGQLFVSDSSIGSSGLILGYRYQSGVAEYARIQARNAVGATNIAMQAGGGNVGIGTSSPGAKLDVTGNILLSGQSTAEQKIVVGYGRSGNGYSYIDLVGDTTYAPGLRLIRGNTGANAISSLEHRGTGDLRIVNYEAAPICFYTSSSEKARIDSSGNLLVGTTSSLARLTASGGTSAGAVGLITSGQTGTTVRSNSVFRIQSEAAGRDVYMQFSDNVANATEIGMISGNQYFCTGAVERMRIDSSGNVGIGTTSLYAKFTVSTSNENFELNPGLASVWDGGVIEYINRASPGTRTNLNLLTNGAFKVYTGGANERMRILSTGEVGIGTSSPSTLLHVKSSGTSFSQIRIDTSSASASAYLEFAENGTVKWYQTNDYSTDRLYIIDENSNDGVYLAQNATSWTANSDSRLKNVIGPILGAVEKLNSINGVLYSWKSDPKNRVYPGVLAQDVQSVLPEAVDSDVPERLGVRYTELIPLLVNAIKELKAEIDILKARN